MNLDKTQFDSINKYLLVRFTDEGKPVIYQELNDDEKIKVYNAFQKEQKKVQVSTTDTIINNVVYYWDLSKRTIHNGYQSFRNNVVTPITNNISQDKTKIVNQCDKKDCSCCDNTNAKSNIKSQCGENKDCSCCSKPTNVNNKSIVDIPTKSIVDIPINERDTDEYDNMLLEILQKELDEHDNILMKYSTRRDKYESTKDDIMIETVQDKQTNKYKQEFDLSKNQKKNIHLKKQTDLSKIDRKQHKKSL